MRSHCLAVDEFSVREGRGRIDLASVAEILHGYEIKGQNDRLVRLKTQVPLFSKVCNRLTLVTTKNHLKQAEHHIPPWWEIILARREGGDRVDFEIKRAGQPNPELDTYAMAFLLWKEEMLDLLRSQEQKVHDRTPKSILAIKISELGDPLVIWGYIKSYIEERARGQGDWAEAHIRD